MHRSEFSVLVKDAAPEVVEEINKQQGLLHFEIEVMCRRAQRAIYANDVETLTTIFALALKGYLNGNKALNSWAWVALPEPLKELYIRFHGEVGT